MLPCSPCNLPRRNLTFSYTNSSFGGNTVPMVYDSAGGDHWTADDTGFTVTGFLACGTGMTLIVDFGDPPVECGLGRPSPNNLTLISFDCNPLMLIFSTCSTLAAFGFGTFTIADTAVAA